MMSATSSKRRKICRRSSTFAPGRIKPSQGKAAFGGDLYEAIDPERPDDERLCMLTKSCLQYTLQKLEEEMTQVDDFHLIRKDIEDAMLREIADMEEKGKFKDYTQKERSLPNPVNMEMEETEKQIKLNIDRYNKEVEDWDNKIKEIEENTTEFKNKEKMLSEDEIPPEVKSLASEYMCGTYDYNSILKEVDTSVKARQIHVYSHANDVQQLKKGYDTVTEILDNQIQKINKEAFQGLEYQSPRKLIMKMTEHSQ